MNRFVRLKDLILPVTLIASIFVILVPLPAGIPSAPFTRFAVETEGVVTLPGSGFGPAGEGYFRIALTVGPDRLTDAVGRLGRALAAFQARSDTSAA